MKELQNSISTLTKPSLSAIKKKIIDYASRPLSEFNTHEALDMFELLENTARDLRDENASYYCVAFQTARTKTDYPKEHFRSLVLRLLGDKDHQAVFDIIGRLEKTMSKRRSAVSVSRSTPPCRRESPRRDMSTLRCFFCHRLGHIAARCYAKRRSMFSGQTLLPETSEAFDKSTS